MFKMQIARFAFRSLCAAVIAAGVVAVPAQLAAQQPYHVIDHWRIGGEGGWDYLLVDSGAHRLYIRKDSSLSCRVH